MHKDYVLFEERTINAGKTIATITLNDPKSLNALSLNMIDLIGLRLIEWADRDDIVCVLMKGAGDKAFCAGGNIRDLYNSILETNYGKNAYAEQFFSKEFCLDYMIHRYNKPIICFAQGFVMGGGVGLMNGASHRIVSESSVLAMPEIKIGLFPDVGSSWFLTKMPPGVGAFLGMTGAKLKAEDALYIGMADYFMEEQQLACLEDALVELEWSHDNKQNFTVLDHYLAKYCKTEHISYLKRYSTFFKHDIAGNTPPEVLQNLLASSAFEKYATALQRGCPATAWIVYEQIKQAKHLSLSDVFRMEFNIAIMCTRYRDFCEGIRALLVDKDNRPQWEEKSLSDVTMKKVTSFFRPLWSKEAHPLVDIECFRKERFCTLES